MTGLALTQKLDGPKSKRLGVMVGETKDGKGIWVRRDGEVSRSSWHKSFWESDPSYPKSKTI